MNPIERIHEQKIHRRRVRVLAELFARRLEPGWSVLDVGTGDGILAQLISGSVEDMSIRGVELTARNGCAIEVIEFDGAHLPFPADSFDAVTFCDVLHHASEPMALLKEAKRVARSAIVIKDHLREGILAGPTLRLMDRVGNSRYGIAIPGNYWTVAQWKSAFGELELRLRNYETKLALYPWYLNWWFGRGLHFVARLELESKGDI